MRAAALPQAYTWISVGGPLPCARVRLHVGSAADTWLPSRASESIRQVVRICHSHGRRSPHTSLMMGRYANRTFWKHCNHMQQRRRDPGPGFWGRKAK